MSLDFTKRPVLAMVMSLFLLLLGLLSLSQMPMSLFPSIAPPEVNVTVEYTGANAETVAKAAIVPLERAINGVPGMKYMSSDTGNDGVGVVQILFETGTDPDVAAVNVQNRVNSVMGELPEEVIKNGVKIAKEENAILLYLSIFSDNPDHDEKFLYNFADINVLAELKRIHGVGFADILGAKEYAMRVWLKPEKLATYSVSTDEIIKALKGFNLEAAPGKIGENSDRANVPLQYTLKYTGKFSTPEEYGNIPIRADASGQILKIRDVANVEFGTTYFDVEAKYNGRPAASIVLKQLPGSNAREVIEEVKRRIAMMKAENFLPGMDYTFGFDVSRFLDASVNEVLKTLLEAFILVFVVIFIFLQNGRATVVPMVAVPVSLVGAFAFIQFLGFSLNLITLFAVVLAIGIVVDDAIVVVEAVHGKMERGASPMRATREAMGEIRGAIVSITLVMACVFIPVAFLKGPSGIFYRQFALTMAVSIVLSGIVALSLTPAMCSLVLKPHASNSFGRLQSIFAEFNKWFTRMENGYGALLGRLLRRSFNSWSLWACFIVLAGLLSFMVPLGFIPQEDQGTFYVSVTAPPGATLERTKQVVDEIQRVAHKERGVEGVATLAGTNILSDGTGATYGTVLVNLVPWENRDVSLTHVMERIKRGTAHIHDAQLEYFPPPPVPGYGNASGFELRLLDKTGHGDFTRFESVVLRFLDDLKSQPEIASAFTIFNAQFPQYVAKIDMARAAQKGVNAETAMESLKTLIGSEYASNFIRFGQMYKVMVQALPEYRSSPEDLLRHQIRNTRGDMVPLSAFMTLEKSHGVDQITRYNMYPSAELNGEGTPGVSSGTVLNVIKRVAATKLPKGYAIDWAGISRDEVNAGSDGIAVFWLCLVFVFLVLAAQYESFLLPLPVLLSLPPGVFGSFFALKLAGLENNIYTHISLIMLVGLLGKNAILIVEFAELKRRSGLEPLDAVVSAAKERLRPILMTSIAFFAGLLPLVLANGAGAMGNRTIGTAAAGGILFGTIFGLLLVPGFYLAFVKLGKKLWKRETTESAESPHTLGEPGHESEAA